MAGPLPTDQVNLTDKESRIMPVAGGEFEQCYNAQAVVAADRSEANHKDDCPLLHRLRAPCNQAAHIIWGNGRPRHGDWFPMLEGSDACALRC